MLNDPGAFLYAGPNAISDLCRAFEERLRTEGGADVLVALASAPPGREAEALVELLLIDARFHGAVDLEAQVEERLSGFPQLAAQARDLIDQRRTASAARDWATMSVGDARLFELLSEWSRRRRAGESVAAEQLAPQDPVLAQALRRAIHDLLAFDQFVPDRDETQGSRSNDTRIGAGADLEMQKLEQSHAASLTIDQVLDRLRQAGCSVALERATALALASDLADGTDLVSRLEAEGLLTAFQSERLLGDRPDSLLIGGYLLLSLLGAGGMGQVYLARHLAMDRVVAIKLLPHHAVCSLESVSRFRREMQAAARLVHPNIVCAYDAGDSRGRHYLAMEYVKGEDLAARVRRAGPFPVLEAIDLVDQAAAGLEYAHSRGMIHRDIKPSNLLLDERGVLKVVDFGLARFADGREANGAAELTSTNAIMGTVDFMPPEQATDARNVDRRADIYSLGCTLHYLIAGRSPYRGESAMARMLAHRERPIPSLRTIGATIPASLDDVFQRMLAKRPDDRFDSIADVRRSLRAAREEVLTGSMVTRPRPARARRRRWLGGATVLAGVAAIVLVAALAATLVDHRTARGTIVLEVNEPGAVVEVLAGGCVELSRRGGAEKLTLDVGSGKKRLRVKKAGFEPFSKEFIVGDNATENVVVRLQPIAERAHSAQPPTPPALQAGDTVRPVAAKPPQSVDPVPETAKSAAEAFDEPRAAKSNFDWSIGPERDILPGIVARPAGLPGVERWQIRAATSFRIAAWSPDGQAIAYGDGQGALWIENAATHRKQAVVQAHQGPVASLAWSPDGAWIASCGSDKLVRLWNPDGTAGPTLSGHIAAVNCVAWSPDSKKLASSGDWTDQSVRIWSVDGSLLQTLAHASPVQCVAWSPEGTLVAAAAKFAKTIVLWSAVDGTEQGRLGPTPDYVTSLAWSPIETRLASNGGDWNDAQVGGYIWDIKAKRIVLDLEQRAAPLIAFAWHPDGGLVAATSDNYLQVYDLDTGKMAERAPLLLSGIAIPSWSPDGRQLADGEGKVWEVKAEEPRFSLTHGSDDRINGLEAIDWGPDRRLVTCGQDAVIRIWSIEGSIQRAFGGPAGSPRSVTWSGDGGRVLSAGFDDATARILDVADASSVTLAGHSGRIRSAEFDPAGDRVATVSDDGTARVWSADGTLRRVLEGHSGAVLGVAWSSDGARLATGGYDGTVRLWSAEGESQGVLTGHHVAVQSVDWHPDGKRLASCGWGDGAVLLWDIEKRSSLVLAKHGHAALQVAWSPTGDRLVSVAKKDGLLLYDEKGATLHAVPVPENIRGVAWSPAGDAIAACAVDGTIRVWSRDGTPERTIFFGGGERSVTFSASGERLSRSSDDLDATLVYQIESPPRLQHVLTGSEFDAFVDSERTFDEWRSDSSTRSDGLEPSSPTMTEAPPIPGGG